MFGSARVLSGRFPRLVLNAAEETHVTNTHDATERRGCMLRSAPLCLLYA